MSEILAKIDVNDYGVQSMTVSGSSTEDLSVELGSQDAALSLQETKIDQLEAALDAKIALDLTNATSDANATAGDIKKDKTAYVNGSKLTGTLEATEPVVLPNNIKFQGSTATDFSWLSNVDTSNITDAEKMFKDCANLMTVGLFNTENVTTVRDIFSGCTNLRSVPLFDFKNVTDMQGICYSCSKITTAPLWNTSNVTNMNQVFRYCTALTTVPIFDTSKVTYMWRFVVDCPNLSDESLNNILAMCANSAMTSDKTLAWVGLDSTQQATCQTLSNWDAFVAAGWSAS